MIFSLTCTSSTNLPNENKSFEEFTGTKELKIIKHCKTRWLSLEKAVQRILHQRSAFHAYFDREAEDDMSACVAILNQHFKSPLMKLVTLFIEYAPESLCRFNATFQSSLPMLPSLKVEVKRMLWIFFWWEV